MHPPSILSHILALSLCIALSSGQTSFDFTGTIAVGETCHQRQLVINDTEDTKVISFFLEIDDLEGDNVLAAIGTEQIPCDKYTPALLSTLASQSSTDLHSIDLNAAISGFLTVINIDWTANVSIVHMTLFNFAHERQLLRRYDVVIRAIDSVARICLSCFTGQSLVSYFDNRLGCQCFPCLTDFVGSRCQYRLTDLELGSRPYPLNANRNIYFRVTNPQGPVIVTASTNDDSGIVRAYAQYEYEDQMHLAGRLNSMLQENGTPFERTIETTSTHFTIQPKGTRNILITFSNYGTASTTINITRSQESESQDNIGLILGVVLGTIALIVGLIILRIVCVNKTARRQIVNVPQVALTNEEKLSHQEISKYFPPVVAQSVLPRNILSHLECAVCLTDIEKNSVIRVTYCKHIFHGHCLSSWFEKMQSCPMCRHDVNIEKTSQEYETVCQQVTLKGQALVRAILGQSKVEDSSRLPPLNNSHSYLKDPEEFNPVPQESLRPEDDSEMVSYEEGQDNVDL